MSADAPDLRACPRCGSDSFDAGPATADRTCRACGARYRPAATAMQRGLIGGALVIPSLAGVVVAVVGLAVAIDAPPNNGGQVAAGLACFAFFGIASGIGLLLGLRALRGRPAAVLDSPGPPGRPVPPDRAVAVVRALAEDHNARHILKQLDGIRPDRIARARARFARAMTDDEVALVLVDTSFLRNGRSGLLLTNRAIYSTRLPHPVALEDVGAVRHRPPEAQVTLVDGGMFLLHLLFPPAVLLLLPLALRRRERKWHALLVNGRVAYTGQKNLVWDFWVDVLSALRAEFGGPPGPVRMTVLEIVHQGAEGAVVGNPRVPNPSWARVEAAIRALDGWANPAVVLWAGSAEQPVGLEVRGGTGRYALRQLPEGWVLHDPARGGEVVEVSVGEYGYRCPAHATCSDLETVLAVAQAFLTTGGFGSGRYNTASGVA